MNCCVPRLALGLIMVPSLASPQERPVVKLGDRVRAELSASPARASRETVLGLLVALTPDTIVVLPDRGGEVALPTGIVTRLEFRQVRTHVGQGVGIGFLAGAGLGAIVGLALGSPDCGPSSTAGFCLPRGALVAGGAVALGLGGMLIGAAIGAVPQEHWEPVPLDQLRPAASLVARRFVAGFSLPFPRIGR